MFAMTFFSDFLEVQFYRKQFSKNIKFSFARPEHQSSASHRIKFDRHHFKYFEER
jgi:hypothetical protein